MQLKSMTGFARIDSQEENLKWHWEARSVNSRGLDIKIKLPQEYNIFEQHIRKAISNKIVRGSVSVYLNIQTTASQSEFKINEEVLNQVIKAVEYVRTLTNTTPPTAEGLLALSGVLEFADSKQNLLQDHNIQLKILESFDAVLQMLNEERQNEGCRLSKILNNLIHEIETHTSYAKTSPARAPDNLKKRISEQISRIMDVGTNMDVSRIHQEAVLLAARYDIEEELQRLNSHILAFKDLMNGGGSVGRRLEFLAQEFHREANTLTSKAFDIDISKCGLELKTLIDRVREQVQNIE